MSTNAEYLSGAPGSPYTRKMLAVMRYRRIPYRFICHVEAHARGLPKSKVRLLPTFYVPGPDGALQAVTDSSPIIRRLEKDYPERSVIPSDPAVAFIDMLLEDYGDEWLTKAMFHYRWVYPEDIKRSAEVLPHWRGLSRPDDEIAVASKEFSERQIGRLYVVGSNPDTASVIENSYLRFVDALNAHLREHPYLLGKRPSASDFAIFGQLTQLAQFDPTPMALTLERAPRIYAWTSLIEDLSGEEPDEDGWFTGQALPATMTALLTEIGRSYVPVMLANARAVGDGAETVEATVDGQRWVQQPFPYQAKCVRWLREAYAALADADRANVDRALAGTGCEQLLSA